MFHYSGGRLASLDDMVLKISAPSKVTSAISKCALDSEPYVKVKKVQKRKARRTCRPPLTDKTFVNNAVAGTPLNSQLKSLERPTVEKPRGQQESLFPPNEPVTRVTRSQHDIESFHPLPPLPSASTLQLPSFLNFSTTHSLFPSSHANQCPPKSSRSLPASTLFRRSSSHVSVRRVVIRKTKNAKVYEGPQWIPAFHHPNSPYVPWSSPTRRRILLPLIPESPISPLCSRSGAVAPEPWGSHSTTEIQTNAEKRSSSWKNFMGSVKSGLRGAKRVVSRIGNVQKFSRRRADLSTTNWGADPSTGYSVVFAESPSLTSPSPQTENASSSRVSLGSLVSSDSTTLAAWLAERHTTSGTSRECPGMSIEEYEMMGSWLDLRRGNGDWVCGVRDCDVHTPDGSVGALRHEQRVFRTAMPFDATDHHEPLKIPVPKKMTLPVSPVDSPTPLPFCSLPQLPSRSSAMSPKVLETLGNPSVERLLMSKKSRELDMPGGWTFTS